MIKLPGKINPHIMKKLYLPIIILLMTTLCGCGAQSGDKNGCDTSAVLTTNKGDIKICLYTEEAPETTKNFIELSKQGKYDGTIFHRVIKDFMIQGGDFENRNGTGGYSYLGKGTSLKDEFGKGLTHKYGAVSMANAGPNTGGSQFFIVQKKEGTDWLDGKHAIFGYVYEGMDIVDEIANVETNGVDKPLEDVIVEKVEIIE
jgi:cyclophilin family peptidyl-prolyl cis-trans isomerase